MQIIGYCLSDCKGAKAAFFFRGKRDSGKSVTLDFVSRLLGEDVISAVYLHDMNQKFEIAHLAGAKINLVGETKDGKMNAEAINTYKMATGGDRVTGAYKGKDSFSFRVRCKFVYAGNSLPSISGSQDSTDAVISRMRVLAFDHTTDRKEWNLNLADDLWAERDGIFTLAIRELPELRKSNFTFVEPEASKKYLQNFVSDSNGVDKFIQDVSAIRENIYIRKGDLFDAYIQYCNVNDIKPLGKSAFYDKILSQPSILEAKIRIDKRQVWVFKGIALKDNPSVLPSFGR